MGVPGFARRQPSWEWTAQRSARNHTDGSVWIGVVQAYGPTRRNLRAGLANLRAYFPAALIDDGQSGMDFIPGAQPYTRRMYRWTKAVTIITDGHLTARPRIRTPPP